MIGESFINENIGIVKVLSRTFKTSEKKWTKKLPYELLHTLIVALTAIGSIIAINFSHPNTISSEEMAAIICIPVTADLIYTFIRVKPK